MTRELAHDFIAYHDIATQIYRGEPLPDDEYAGSAKHAATKFDLPWPPSLGEADEFVLHHGPQIDFLIRTTPGLKENP